MNNEHAIICNLSSWYKNSEKIAQLIKCIKLQRTAKVSTHSSRDPRGNSQLHVQTNTPIAD